MQCQSNCTLDCDKSGAYNEEEEFFLCQQESCDRNRGTSDREVPIPGRKCRCNANHGIEHKWPEERHVPKIVEVPGEQRPLTFADNARRQFFGLRVLEIVHTVSALLFGQWIWPREQLRTSAPVKPASMANFNSAPLFKNLLADARKPW